MCVQVCELDRSPAPKAFGRERMRLCSPGLLVLKEQKPEVFKNAQTNKKPNPNCTQVFPNNKKPFILLTTSAIRQVSR